MLGFGEDWLASRIIVLVPLWLSLAVHEWAHAWCAFRLGDDTAARLGRLSLNPLDHVDPIGTLALPLLGVPFGWAKPVPVNPSRFHRGVTLRGGMALTAAAGPVSNVCLALAAALVLVGLGWLDAGWVAPASVARRLLEWFVFLNVALALFNLLPLPPLDGSRIVDAVVPPRLARAWSTVVSFGPLGLVLVLVAPALLGVSLFGWPFEQVQVLLEALLPGAG